MDLPLDHAISDFARDLRLDKSPRTIATYTDSCQLYQKWHLYHGGKDAVSGIAPASIRAWLTELRDSGKSVATIANRHGGLKAFLNWCVAEHLISDNPMAGIPKPVATAPPVPVLAPKDLQALLKSCAGERFEDVRDTAMLRLLIDTGMRREECASLRLTDLDLDQDVAVVMGKGSRIRGCPFGTRTSKALRRYLRVRPGHDYAHRPELWLGKRGPIQGGAIIQMLKNRARHAGLVSRVFVHQLRHTWAHEALQRMNEGDVQRLGGWRDREMLTRYGASGADERARRAYREHSLGDRL
jgi:site-specific recombinase XerD